MGDSCCRPLGFLIGLPFALLSLVLTVVGGISYVIGSLLSCVCPCCSCFAVLANLAIDLITLPLEILRWFTSKIPC